VRNPRGPGSSPVEKGGRRFCQDIRTRPAEATNVRRLAPARSTAEPQACVDEGGARNVSWVRPGRETADLRVSKPGVPRRGTRGPRSPGPAVGTRIFRRHDDHREISRPNVGLGWNFFREAPGGAAWTRLNPSAQASARFWDPKKQPPKSVRAPLVCPTGRLAGLGALLEMEQDRTARWLLRGGGRDAAETLLRPVFSRRDDPARGSRNSRGFGRRPSGGRGRFGKQGAAREFTGARDTTSFDGRQ